ncbi:MAG: hypothetical protein J6V68_05210 [Clostridia bacterium]|nr:hypothetical protein [Clostridia bacterium]
MALKDIGIGKKKFNMAEKPWKTPWYLTCLEAIILSYYMVIAKLKIKKDPSIKDIKGPFLMLQNHGSFIDFGLAVKAFKLRPMTWVSSIEEFNHREWLLRSLGCFGKRKFTADLNVVKNIMHALKKQKLPVVIYPEARFAFAGITEEIDAKSYARLIKMAGVPVVVGIAKGNFIRSPQWRKHPYQNIPAEMTLTQIITKEETATLSAEEITKRIEKAFDYDDYKYWQESGRRIKSKKRAENLHKVLYQCPHCKKEFEMTSYGTTLECKACGKKWTLTEYGKLVSDGEVYFEHIPDWYRWIRQNVETEVYEGRYSFKDTARIEKLISSSKGFVPIGTVELTHGEDGWTAKGKLDNGEDFYLNRPVDSMYSCHIEYDYKKRGDALELATTEDTYFVYPLNNENILTKFHFATEALYHKITGDHIKKS